MISNARSIISWTSSGSRRSEMLVNPHTSAKSTVTCLRVHLAPRGAPHSPQNFIPRVLTRTQGLQFPPRSTVSRIDGSEGVPIAISSSRLSRFASMVPDVSNGKIDHDGTELGRFSCAGRGVVPERETITFGPGHRVRGRGGTPLAASGRGPLTPGLGHLLVFSAR